MLRLKPYLPLVFNSMMVISGFASWNDPVPFFALMGKATVVLWSIAVAGQVLDILDKKLKGIPYH